MIDTLTDTWSQPENPPSGARHPASPQSTGGPTRKLKNSKSYERTRQPIENKGEKFSKPIILLKVRWLAQLSRQDTENKRVIYKERVVESYKPVNLLKFNMVSSLNPVKSLRLKR